MKILWHSNAPWASTGYGNQTKMFCKRIKELGHDVAISAFWGLEGGYLHYEGMPVLPRGYLPYGKDVLAAHSMTFGADITISLIDAWVIEPQMLGACKWVPWFPVDMQPLPPIVFKMVNQAFDRIVYSRFAEKMVNNAGLSCRYVPHGVETKIYKPLDRSEARDKLRIKNDRFLIGMVAANKDFPSRKNFEPSIRAFADLHRKFPDALLYIHSSTGEFIQNAQNLVEICKYHGLTVGHQGTGSQVVADVIFADSYSMMMGYPPEYMVNLYNALDVLLSPSMGEGFGLPILEAQACGCPAIVGDWTSMSELNFSGYDIPTEEAEPFWTQLASFQYIPRAGAICDMLEYAFDTLGDRPNLRKEIVAKASEYDADRVVKSYWKPVLQEIEGNL